MMQSTLHPGLWHTVKAQGFVVLLVKYNQPNVPAVKKERERETSPLVALFLLHLLILDISELHQPDLLHPALVECVGGGQ